MACLGLYEKNCGHPAQISAHASRTSAIFVSAFRSATVIGVCAHVELEVRQSHSLT